MEYKQALAQAKGLVNNLNRDELKRLAALLLAEKIQERDNKKGLGGNLAQ